MFPRRNSWSSCLLSWNNNVWSRLCPDSFVYFEFHILGKFQMHSDKCSIIDTHNSWWDLLTVTMLEVAMTIPISPKVALCLLTSHENLPEISQSGVVGAKGIYLLLCQCRLWRPSLTCLVNIFPWITHVVLVHCKMITADWSSSVKIFWHFIQCIIIWHLIHVIMIQDCVIVL